MRSIGITVAAVLMLGCGKSEVITEKESQEKNARALELRELQAVAKSAAMNLRNPDSAKFRNVRKLDISREPSSLVIPVYCGEVNGKNAYGAYAGFQKFAVLVHTASKGEAADIWDENEPATGLAYMVHCQDDGKERPGGMPVSLDG